MPRRVPGVRAKGGVIIWAKRYGERIGPAQVNGQVAIYFGRVARSPLSHPPSWNRCAKEANDRLNDTPEHVPRQHRGLAHDEVVTRGEQLARASVADDAQ